MADDTILSTQGLTKEFKGFIAVNNVDLAIRRGTIHALIDFLAYAGKSPLVAFRAEFDRAVLERATLDVLGISLRLPFVDLAFLLPALFRGTACDGLDDWVAHFGGDVAVRHHALGDAYATAQLLLIALAAADAAGMGSPAQLLATQKAQRWLGTRR